MGNKWVAVLDRWLDYGVLETVFLDRLARYYRLGPLHLGCNREVAALLKWLHAFIPFHCRYTPQLLQLQWSLASYNLRVYVCLL